MVDISDTPLVSMVLVDDENNRTTFTGPIINDFTITEDLQSKITQLTTLATNISNLQTRLTNITNILNTQNIEFTDNISDTSSAGSKLYIQPQWGLYFKYIKYSNEIKQYSGYFNITNFMNFNNIQIGSVPTYDVFLNAENIPSNYSVYLIRSNNSLIPEGVINKTFGIDKLPDLNESDITSIEFIDEVKIAFNNKLDGYEDEISIYNYSSINKETLFLNNKILSLSRIEPEIDPTKGTYYPLKLRQYTRVYYTKVDGSSYETTTTGVTSITLNIYLK